MQGKKANISQEKLKELMQEHTLIEIAEILNVSISTIKRYKKKYGLEINKEISRQRNSIKHSIYNYDLTYFEKIDNMNKAYLLGFICADGYLTTGRNEFGITVSEKDKNIIEFFKDKKLIIVEVESEKMAKDEKSLEIIQKRQRYYLNSGFKKYDKIYYRLFGIIYDILIYHIKEKEITNEDIIETINKIYGKKFSEKNLYMNILK